WERRAGSGLLTSVRGTPGPRASTLTTVPHTRLPHGPMLTTALASEVIQSPRMPAGPTAAAASVANASTGLANDDRALHAEARMKWMAAFQRILASAGGERDIDARLGRNLDLAVLHQRGGLRRDPRVGKELRGGKAVAAVGDVAQMEHGRNAGLELN